MIESDHIFVLSDKTATEPEIRSFKKYYIICSSATVVGSFWSKKFTQEELFFPLDNWVVKDRGGECFSTLAKQFAIFSPNILHRRLLSPGNNTGQHAENTI